MQRQELSVNEYNEKKKYQQTYFDFKNGHFLTKFIKTVPNLDQIKFQLSVQEQQIVGSSGNIVVIGRSGTGKTTCALMRLFAIQLLYKNKQSKKLIKQNSTTVSKRNYISEVFGLRNIFLTASPVLIAQIKQNYEELVKHVVKELNSIQAREKFNMSTEESIIDLMDEVIEEGKQNRYGFERMNQLQQDIQNQADNISCLQALKEDQFPGFFATSSFLVMIDGSLVNPFFIRDPVRKRTKKNKPFMGRQHNYTEYQVRRPNGYSYFGCECDYDYFYTYFWQKVGIIDIIKRILKYNKEKVVHKKITPVVVWTEIISVIKGHCVAYAQKGRHLTLEQYLKYSKNIYYGQVQKRAIFQIFVYYQEWRISSQKFRVYDIMDLVNHILFQSEEDFYYDLPVSQGFVNKTQLARLHNMFLDEVQDLPPATIYLLSRLFNDGLYYAGDTAQAIQKGVAFKFSDVLEMFHPQFKRYKLPFELPTKHELTFNFRTHNNILLLANSVIQMIEELFPKSIDRLKRQESDKTGPMPLIMSDIQLGTIRYLLTDGDEKRGLDPEQVILVRDEKAKKTMPQQLKDLNGIVLTVQQVKGSQYRDVIIYNCFDKNLSAKWKVLKYISLYPSRGNKTVHLQQIQISEYDMLIVQLKKLYTLVTRAKSTLILIDESIPHEILQIWQSKGLIYSEKFIEKIKGQIDEYSRNESRVKVGRCSWEQRGFTFYQRRNYKQALECYQRAGMKMVCRKIVAVQIREEADEELHHLERQFKERYQPFQDDDVDEDAQISDQYIQLCQRVKRDLFPRYIEAANIFKQIGLQQSAGKCFFMVREFQHSYRCYSLCEEKWMEKGCCQQKLGLHEKAAENFRKVKEFKRMIWNLERVGNKKAKVNILEKSQQFNMKEYYYRLYLRDYYQEHLKPFSLKPQKIECWPLNLDNSLCSDTFSQLLTLIGWQSQLNRIKREVSDVVHLRSKREDKVEALAIFYKNCARSKVFIAEDDLCKMKKQLFETRVMLNKQMERYPHIFYYPTDDSVYKQLSAELQMIKLQKGIQRLQDQLVLAKVKEVTIYQQLSIDLWIALKYLRSLFLELTTPLNELSGQLFGRFTADMQQMHVVLLKNQLDKEPVSTLIFQQLRDQVKQNMLKVHQSFSKIDKITSKEYLYRNKHLFNFQQELTQLKQITFAFLELHFDDPLNNLKHIYYNQAFKSIYHSNHHHKTTTNIFNREDDSWIKMVKGIEAKCANNSLIRARKEHQSQLFEQLNQKDVPQCGNAALKVMFSLEQLFMNQDSIIQGHLDILAKVEVVAPLVAAQMCFDVKLPIRSIANLLTHFTMQSVVYTQCMKFKGENQQKRKMHLKQLVTSPLVDVDYLRQVTQSTRYKRQTLGHQLVEGLVMLGLSRQLPLIVDADTDLILRCSSFDFTTIVCQQTLKFKFLNKVGQNTIKDKSISLAHKQKATLMLNMFSLVEQFLLLDQYSSNPWGQRTESPVGQLIGQKWNLLSKTIAQEGFNHKYKNSIMEFDPQLLDLFREQLNEALIANFIKNIDSIHGMSQEEIVITLGIFLKVKKQERVYGFQKYAQKLSNFKQFQGKMSELENFLKNPFQNDYNFKIFKTLLTFFRCRLITHEDDFLSCLEHFVLVHRSSPLLKYLKAHQITWCYGITQRKDVFLIKFVDCWCVLVNTLLPQIKFNVQKSTRSILLFSLPATNKMKEPFGIDISVRHRIRQIQVERTKVLQFYLETGFIAPQSFYHIYQQLKAYRDVLTILRQADLNPLAIERARDESKSIQKQFESWKQYALEFEVKRRM